MWYDDSDVLVHVAMCENKTRHIVLSYLSYHDMVWNSQLQKKRGGDRCALLQTLLEVRDPLQMTKLFLSIDTKIQNKY